MFIVKKTGLVPVISKKRGGRQGIFGVPPAVARAGVLAGELEFAGVPDGIAVDEVDDPASEVSAEQPPKEPDELVEIPVNWEERHPLTWINLAKKITGKDIVLTDEQKQAEVKPSQVAKDIITAEIQRRAAAEQPTE